MFDWIQRFGTNAGPFDDSFWVGFWPALLLVVGQIFLFMAALLVFLAGRSLGRGTKASPGNLRLSLIERIGSPSRRMLVAVTLAFAFTAWAVLPVSPGWIVVDSSAGALCLLAALLLANLATGLSRALSAPTFKPADPPLLPLVRATPFLVTLGIVLLIVTLLAGSMQPTEIVRAQSSSVWSWHILNAGSVFLFPVMFAIFLLYAFAILGASNQVLIRGERAVEGRVETHADFSARNRTTDTRVLDDLSLLTFSAVAVLFFFGGWHGPVQFGAMVDGVQPLLVSFGHLTWFGLKTLMLFAAFSLFKSILPYLSHRQLMGLGWKLCVPASLLCLVLIASQISIAGG